MTWGRDWDAVELNGKNSMKSDNMGGSFGEMEAGQLPKKAEAVEHRGRGKRSRKQLRGM